MFSKRKKIDDIQYDPRKDNIVFSLRTEDGGYLGPADSLDLPSEATNNNYADNKNDQNNYKNRKKTQLAPIAAITHVNRRASTLGHLNDPVGMKQGAGGRNQWVGNADDISASASMDGGSSIEKPCCCNPDYGMCGGCCYPSACLGFGHNQSIVFMAIGVFLIMGGLIAGIVLLFTTTLYGSRMCATPECVIAAGNILSSMDQTTDPCQDFVQFTCGGWHRQYPVPEGKMGWDSFSQIADSTHYRLKELLEAPPAAGDPRAVNLTKAFYAACTNDTAWEAVGVAPLLKELNRVGGFPMINSSWKDTSYDWVNSVVLIRKLYAAEYLFGVEVSFDEKNNTMYAIHLSEGYIPSPREYILSNETRFKRNEMERINSIVKMLTSPPSSAAIRSSPTRHSLNSRDASSLYSGPHTSASDGTTSLHVTLNDTDDALLEQVLLTARHRKKMMQRHQLRRTDAVLGLDGIAPDVAANGALQILLDEVETEPQRMSARQTNQKTTEAEKLFDFIYNLANLSMTSEQQGDINFQYNPMTVRQLQQRTDALNDSVKINWLSFFNAVFSDVNVTITWSERIIVGHPSYIDGVLRLIKRTPASVIANFLGYMMVLNFGEEATSAMYNFRSTSFRWNSRNYIGRKETRPWYDCSAKANTLLGSAVGYLYLTSSYSDETTLRVQEMVSDVHEAFRGLLHEAHWMDERTLSAGLLKLDQMIQLVGYSNDARNAVYLDTLYQQMPNLSSTQHFSNVLLVARYLSNKSLALLLETPRRDEFAMDPVTINAAYSFSQNSMLIPAGILQAPFYRPNTIRAINYGAIGVVIGHEISHGFDDAGKEVDEIGNLREWWTNSSTQMYYEKAQCFVDQYSQYPVEADLKPDEMMLKGYKLNGAVTQGENIADNGGIQAAFRAYLNRKRLTKDATRLPGLEQYTDEQLFFISFAQVWCTSFSPEGLKGAILLGPHSPGPCRVRGSYHNMKEMRDAFNCPADNSTNFNRTCRLW